MAARPHPLGPALIAVSAIASWGLGRAPWLSVVASDDKQGEVTRTLTGAVWAPTTTALSLAVIATAVVVYVVKPVGRRLIGAVAALAGLAALWQPLALLVSQPSADRARDLLVTGQATSRASHPQTISAWAVIDHISVNGVVVGAAIVAAVAAVVGGVVVILRPGQGQAVSKYDSAAARQQDAKQALDTAANTPAGDAGTDAGAGGDSSYRVLWDALDAGIDPTDTTTRKDPS